MLQEWGIDPQQQEDLELGESKNNSEHSQSLEKRRSELDWEKGLKGNLNVTELLSHLCNDNRLFLKFFLPGFPNKLKTGICDLCWKRRVR
jgi:hypothetical protein